MTRSSSTGRVQSSSRQDPALHIEGLGSRGGVSSKFSSGSNIKTATNQQGQHPSSDKALTPQRSKGEHSNGSNSKRHDASQGSSSRQQSDILGALADIQSRVDTLLTQTSNGTNGLPANRRPTSAPITSPYLPSPSKASRPISAGTAPTKTTSSPSGPVLTPSRTAANDAGTTPSNVTKDPKGAKSTPVKELSSGLARTPSNKARLGVSILEPEPPAPSHNLLFDAPGLSPSGSNPKAGLSPGLLRKGPALSSSSGKRAGGTSVFLQPGSNTGSSTGSANTADPLILMSAARMTGGVSTSSQGRSSPTPAAPLLTRDVQQPAPSRATPSSLIPSSDPQLAVKPIPAFALKPLSSAGQKSNSEPASSSLSASKSKSSTPILTPGPSITTYANLSSLKKSTSLNHASPANGVQSTGLSTILAGSASNAGTALGRVANSKDDTSSRLKASAAVLSEVGSALDGLMRSGDKEQPKRGTGRGLLALSGGVPAGAAAAAEPLVVADAMDQALNGSLRSSRSLNASSSMGHEHKTAADMVEQVLNGPVRMSRLQPVNNSVAPASSAESRPTMEATEQLSRIRISSHSTADAKPATDLSAPSLNRTRSANAGMTNATSAALALLQPEPRSAFDTSDQIANRVKSGLGASISNPTPEPKVVVTAGSEQPQSFLRTVQSAPSSSTGFAESGAGDNTKTGDIKLKSSRTLNSASGAVRGSNSSAGSATHVTSSSNEGSKVGAASSARSVGASGASPSGAAGLGASGASPAAGATSSSTEGSKVGAAGGVKSGGISATGVAGLSASRSQVSAIPQRDSIDQPSQGSKSGGSAGQSTADMMLERLRQSGGPAKASKERNEEKNVPQAQKGEGSGKSVVSQENINRSSSKDGKLVSQGKVNGTGEVGPSRKTTASENSTRPLDVASSEGKGAAGMTAASLAQVRLNVMEADSASGASGRQSPTSPVKLEGEATCSPRSFQRPPSLDLTNIAAVQISPMSPKQTVKKKDQQVVHKTLAPVRTSMLARSAKLSSSLEFRLSELSAAEKQWQVQMQETLSKESKDHSRLTRLKQAGLRTSGAAYEILEEAAVLMNAFGITSSWYAKVIQPLAMTRKESEISMDV